MSPPNSGVIQIGAPIPDADEPRTLIVTGVARSGTSMLATVLTSTGVFMGEHLHSVVMEDAEILAALQSGHDSLLRDIIAHRNGRHGVWGFKVPNLHAFLTAERVSWFRNPRVIVVFRDPVAIAVRDSLSEHFDPQEGLIGAAHATISLIKFVEKTGCPTLFLSYEKAITAPEQMLDTLVSFCGIVPTVEHRSLMLRAVLPNNPAYLVTANSSFEGFVEGISNDHLYGWCHQLDVLAPVALDLIVDDACVATFRAGEYRADLASNRIGNGSHGFRLDLSPYRLTPDATIHVRPNRRTLELAGSGQTVRDLTLAGPSAPGRPKPVSPDIAPAGAPSPATAR